MKKQKTKTIVRDPNIFAWPGMTPREIVKAVRDLGAVSLTSVGMRDAGQSDYKNRLRMYDLKKLAPFYNRMGLFSSECHGGARWHVGIMNRMESPFEELRILRDQMPDVLLQTLVRETNLWGYRPYPPEVIEHVVPRMDIDVWRCFSFLNDIDNMRIVAESVMKHGRFFQPSVSFTQADWTTNEYYLGVVDRIVELTSGVDETILCIKDMAGVGSPKRIGELVDAIKQKYPDLIVQYHRHITDGLAVPALCSAAKSGASILDVEEDSLVRFYGLSPILGIIAYLRESGLKVHINETVAEEAVENARSWVGDYEWAESPFKGYDHRITRYRMPGGAFPSSFEQAEKGGFLDLMPSILHVMSLYNKIIHYFDVTPGSQITWVTCSGIVNRYEKERGSAGVQHLIDLLSDYVENKKCNFDAMNKKDQEELLTLFAHAPGDFKNLLLGRYGKLPDVWPDEWVYKSAFGEKWQEAIEEKNDPAGVDDDVTESITDHFVALQETLGREPTEEEFILYLMHPKDCVTYITFREEYGASPHMLPTRVFRHGLVKTGSSVNFELWGKPYSIELISIGEEHEGIIHVVVKINQKTKVFEVETPRAKKVEIRRATGKNDVGAPINGSVWRIGNTDRGTVKVGDIVHKGEEIANLEAMKMETPIPAPFDARIEEITVKLNDTVEEGQLLFRLDPDNID